MSLPCLTFQSPFIPKTDKGKAFTTFHHCGRLKGTKTSHSNPDPEHKEVYILELSLSSSTWCAHIRSPLDHDHMISRIRAKPIFH